MIDRRGFIKAFGLAVAAPTAIKLGAFTSNPIEIRHEKSWRMDYMADIHYWWFNTPDHRVYHYTAMIDDGLPKADYDEILRFHADRAYEALTRAWRAKA